MQVKKILGFALSHKNLEVQTQNLFFTTRTSTTMNMDIAKPVGAEITRVDFGLYSPEEILQLSVTQITNPTTFDALGNPISGGLYDPKLGAFLRNK